MQAKRNTTAPDSYVALTLHQEIYRLPEKYGEPLILCCLMDFTSEQAAAVLDLPVGTLNSRLSRGRDKLKERLVRRGITLAVGALGDFLDIAIDGCGAVETAARDRAGRPYPRAIRLSDLLTNR